MNQIRRLLSDIGNAFGRLSPRERGLVALTAGIALIFVIGVTALSVSRAVDKRQARIKTKLGQLEEVSKLTAGYRAAESQRGELERKLRGNNVRLFSYIEEMAKRQGIDVGGMNDKGTTPIGETHINESSVEVTFTRISLDKLVRFLSEVEQGAGIVKVTRLQVRPRADEPVLDAWLIISTYQMT